MMSINIESTTGICWSVFFLLLASASAAAIAAFLLGVPIFLVLLELLLEVFLRLDDLIGVE